MAYVVLGLGGVFLLVLLAKWFLNTPPAALARGLRWGGAVVAVGLFIFLAVTERLAPLLALVGAVLTFALQAGSLWREARAEDEPSASLVEAYLDRRFADWRTAGEEAAGGGNARQAAGPASAAMTREEAYAVLGLSAGASPAEIKEAHRRLMQRLHPDHGGSDWLATRINLAKDVLLKA